MILNKESVVVFDLDDTLFKEIDFLKSAYRSIAARLKKELGVDIYNEMQGLYFEGQSTFDIINKKYKTRLSVDEMVYEYRFHKPIISLSDHVIETIDLLRKQKIKIGIITDGRSETQRNKLESLGIMEHLDVVIISEEVGTEKPDSNNYKLVQTKFSGAHFYYIADNTAKDFLTANKLGWTTICLLDDGRNIHSQNFNVEPEYLPNYCVKSFLEIYHLFDSILELH